MLAILQLLRAPAPELESDRRVLFINVDGWHASGVEEAFYTTDRVMCISLHRYAEGAFPGSGGAADSGQGAGKGYNVNLPVADGLDDEGLAALLTPVVLAAAERFCPHCIVACTGAGILSGDRLGCLNVSLEGHGACLSLLHELGVPLLVLGGGGYTQLNSARAWCNATAILCDMPLKPTLPTCEEVPHQLAPNAGPAPHNLTLSVPRPQGLLASYPPDMSLSVPAATMSDLNSAASLEKLREAALATIRSTPQKTKPVPQPKEPAKEDPKPVGEGSQGAPDKMDGAGGAPTATGEGAAAAEGAGSSDATGSGDGMQSGEALAETHDGGGGAGANDTASPMDVDGGADGVLLEPHVA